MTFLATLLSLIFALMLIAIVSLMGKALLMLNLRNQQDKKQEGDNMRHESVKSSNLKSIGYDPSNQILEVAFKNGTCYSYQGVPRERYVALRDADSVGVYFHSHIRCCFAFSKVKQEEVTA